MKRWVYDDGGRAAAGFKGKTGDCVTRAIAIALEKPYAEVYESINELARVSERGKNRDAPVPARESGKRPIGSTCGLKAGSSSPASASGPAVRSTSGPRNCPRGASSPA